MGNPWLELVLTAPVVILLVGGWWLISHQLKEPPSPSSSSDDDGGIRRGNDRTGPLRPFPRFPRRGPHGDPPVPSPHRVRTPARVRARVLSRS